MDRSGRMPDDEVVLDFKHEPVEIQMSFKGPISPFPTYSSSSKFGWMGKIFWTPSNSVKNSVIVGRFFPLKCKYLFARLAIVMTSSLLPTLLEDQVYQRDGSLLMNERNM